MSSPENTFVGTGRRKTAVARVRLQSGSGKLLVNGRDFDRYFSHENFAKQAYAPLLTVDMKEKIDLSVNVVGGFFVGRPVDFERWPSTSGRGRFGLRRRYPSPGLPRRSRYSAGPPVFAR